MRYASLYERLPANSREDSLGCWVWMGAVSGAYGRVSMRVPGKASPQGRLVHREMMRYFVSWRSQLDSDDAQPNGPWDAPLPTTPDVNLHPDGQTVDHLCGNTLCINPDHLDWASRARNTQLMQERKRR